MKINQHNYIDTLLYMWISSRIVDPAIWESLQTGYRNLFHRPEPIVQLKVKTNKINKKKDNQIN